MELNVPVDELVSIQHNFNIKQGGVGKCLTATLEWWYNRTPDCTWADIIAALHAVEERALAILVARSHGKSAPIYIVIPFSRGISNASLYNNCT